MIPVEKVKKGKMPSIIRENFEYAKRRKNEIGDDKVFDFTIGNPFVSPPKIVKDVLNKLVNDEDTIKTHGYTSNIGDPAARETIANFLYKKYNAKVDKNLIMLTCGAAAAICITLNAVLEDNDEVILLSPFFSDYVPYIEGARGKIIISNCDDKTCYPDIDDLKNKITEKTRVVIINSPNNPTGAIYHEDILITINDLLREKEKEYNTTIYVISDEPYREIVYDGKQTPYTANFIDNTISCYSFSKSLSLPGERIGYICVHENVKDKNDLFLSMTYAMKYLGYVCAPSIFQKMIIDVMGYTTDISIYKENRELLYNLLKDLGFQMIYPEGAFYIFMKSPDKDANSFCEKAKKYEIIFVRGDEFGNDKYVRLAYCVDKKVIENSKEAFKKLADEYFK